MAPATPTVAPVSLSPLATYHTPLAHSRAVVNAAAVLSRESILTAPDHLRFRTAGSCQDDLCIECRSGAVYLGILPRMRKKPLPWYQPTVDLERASIGSDLKATVLMKSLALSYNGKVSSAHMKGYVEMGKIQYVQLREGGGSGPKPGELERACWLTEFGSCSSWWQLSSKYTTLEDHKLRLFVFTKLTRRVSQIQLTVRIIFYCENEILIVRTRNLGCCDPAVMRRLAGFRNRGRSRSNYLPT
jgi:hypothetical protein